MRAKHIVLCEQILAMREDFSNKLSDYKGISEKRSSDDANKTIQIRRQNRQSLSFNIKMKRANV